MMKGIYPAALITTVIALALYGTIIWKMKSPLEKRWLWLAFLLVLPLQPLALTAPHAPLTVSTLANSH